jgi:GTPase
VSAAKPKIAAYPFTTLVPQLGVVRPYGDSYADTFVLADIPGLIEGASDGAGLGIKFLKHLERVRVLCHLVEVPIEAVDGFDVDDESLSKTRGPADLVARYTALRKELAAFSRELAKVPELVVINKTDVLPEAHKHPQTKKLVAHLKKKNVPVLFMSGATGDGIAHVTRALAERVRQARADAEAAQQTKPAPRFTTPKPATATAATAKQPSRKKTSTKSGSEKSASTTKAGSKQASRKRASTKKVGSKRTGKARATRTSRAR